MFAKLFTRRRREPTPDGTYVAGRIEPGRRIYCIGDIHGCADLLDEVAGFIAEDAASAPGKVDTLFVGDYVDRGPKSDAVIERLASGDFPTPVIGLIGNHDDYLLRFLEDASFFERWRRLGAMETLHAYGVPLVELMRGGSLESAREALQTRVPQRHLDFLRACRLSYESGDYFFCHAGVRPGLPLDAQSRQDLMTIREPFLSHPEPLGKIVVHGHTRVANVDVRANRIAIDTGAYATGVLSCLVMEEDTLRLYATGQAE